jgi:SAM-dependent methyltransferase
MEVLHHYNEEHHGQRSAQQLVPEILRLLQPSSVIDVGCGLGQWLAVFKKSGLKVVGLDGAHVPKDQLQISSHEFCEVDFRRLDQLPKLKDFDLALSLEVAEHLPPEAADGFVDYLCQLAPHIVFSAAIPNQTGEGHLNEQPPSYWIERFRARGFVCLDAFRRTHWENSEINWWYRQNLMLVVPQESRQRFDFPEWQQLYVHPELFQLYVRKVERLEDQLRHNANGGAGIGFGLKALAGALARKLGLLK